MQSIQRAELPQRRSAHRQFFKVDGPRGFRRFRFTCLSATITAVWVHFDVQIKRNRPCVGVDQCPYCRIGPDRRWQGYLAGVYADTRQCVVVEVTEGCARKMRDAGLLDTSLFGLSLIFYRKPDSKKHNGAVYFDVDNPVNVRNLPPAFDPWPHLLRLWGWNEQHAEEIAAKIAGSDRVEEGEPQDVQRFLGDFGHVPND